MRGIILSCLQTIKQKQILEFGLCYWRSNSQTLRQRLYMWQVITSQYVASMNCVSMCQYTSMQFICWHKCVHGQLYAVFRQQCSSANIGTNTFPTAYSPALTSSALLMLFITAYFARHRGFEPTQLVNITVRLLPTCMLYQPACVQQSFANMHKSQRLHVVYHRQYCSLVFSPGVSSFIPLEQLLGCVGAAAKLSYNPVG